MTELPMMFGGIPIRICEHLPTTKIVTWVTQRKWCHWKKRPDNQFRKHSKSIPCETVMMFGGAMVISSATVSKLQRQIDGNRGEQ